MIRVFVGTHKSHKDAEKVLEYSIRKNTTQDVDLTFMRPGWETPPTGFSSHRYLIPQMCNFKGYAIYLDVDMLVLGDLAELLSYKQAGKWAICKTNRKSRKAHNRDEVAVIDCSAAKDKLPNEKLLKTRQGKDIAKQALAGGGYYAKVIPEKVWNARTLSPESKLIHYTNLRTQPWHPNPSIKYEPFPCKATCDLFFEYLEKANDEL
jgi:hypothetical protein